MADPEDHVALIRRLRAELQRVKEDEALRTQLVGRDPESTALREKLATRVAARGST